METSKVIQSICNDYYLNNITRNKLAVKELNNDFNKYSKIDGRQFLNVIDPKFELAYRLLYFQNIALFVTIEI